VTIIIMNEWVYLKDAKEHYQVSAPTLRRWADTGKIPSRRAPSGHRQFKISTGPSKIGGRSNYLYVRVSSRKQKDDLERQASFLSQQFPQHKIIKDYGSGINYKRKGLVSLLELVEADLVGQIVVASKDRLCRFGFELIDWICEQHDTEIMVLEQNNGSPEEELGAELLDIIQVFCCKRNGKRRYNTNKLLEAKIKSQTSPKEKTSNLGSS